MCGWGGRGGASFQRELGESIATAGPLAGVDAIAHRTMRLGGRGERFDWHADTHVTREGRRAYYPGVKDRERTIEKCRMET